MSETEESKRLASSLKIGGDSFSEITALSQQAINKAMAKLLNYFPEIGNVDAEMPGIGSLKAKAGQPLVSLKVSGASRADAEYFCKFSSGTLQFEQGTVNDPIDVAGWTIAFDVSIDQIDIENGSDEDQRVRSAIQQPGDFSINSLFLTFNESSIMRFDVDNSDFNGYELDGDQSIYLGAILSKWFTGDNSVMNDRQKRTVAYGLQTSKPQSVNENAPTFPPTGLKFQTYEYIAPGKHEPEEGIGKGDNNMLLYLQMTGNQEFPSAGILNYNGNFVSSGMNGTTCIARELFWDSYLLRTSSPLLLQVFNPSTYAWKKEASVANLLEPTWKIGLGEMDHFSDSSKYCWEAKSDNAFEWMWSPKNPEQSYSDKGGDNQEGCSLDINCTTANTMKTEPGENKINVSGKTEIKITAAAWMYFPGVAAYTMNADIHIWATWATVITLKSVETGGLEISLSKPTVDVKSDPFHPHADVAFGGTVDSIKANYEGLMKDLQDKMENLPVVEAEERLRKDLTNSARFVIPGGGTFSYKDPIFNNEGDLMIAASYSE